MNNNRCVICNRIIPEGRQLCPTCERYGGEITSVFSVTPENKFCFECKKKKCNGECKEFKEYMAGLRKDHKGKRIRKKSPANG